MSKDKKLMPELRFPEFANKEEWKIEPLGNLSKEIVEKTKGRKYKLISITSGVGLVSQIEKFGREIAGNSYKNYYVIRNLDFAYNKSSTKLYAEGEIAMFEDEQTGAVPNSIFTCFRFNENIIFPPFAKYPFVNNLHGNWLRKFITVGARANGALQVNSKDLFTVPFPYPNLTEQHKIASCISSLDELIVAHNEKLDVLKDHKKGLMQNLFPLEGETVPKVRFPEFEEDEEWVEKKTDEIIKITSGKGFKASEYSNNGIPLLQIENVGYGSVKWKKSPIHLPHNYKFVYQELLLKEGDIVLALNRPVTNNELKIARLSKFDEPSMLYQRVGRIELLLESLDEEFIFQICSLFIKAFVIRKSIGSDQPFISLKELYTQKVRLPDLLEQQKIASCLSALDELINAQTEIIEQLQLHKKGLMQGLFPNIENL